MLKTGETYGHEHWIWIHDNRLIGKHPHKAALNITRNICSGSGFLQDVKNVKDATPEQINKYGNLLTEMTKL